MDKIKKMKLVSELTAVSSTLNTKDTKSGKLWLYAVGIACGIKMPLVFQPTNNSLSVIFATLGSNFYSGDDEQSKKQSSTYMACQEVLDSANEASVFDTEKVSQIAFNTWAQRQSMIAPLTVPLRAVAGKALSSIQMTYQYDCPDCGEDITDREAQVLSNCVIAVGRVIDALANGFYVTNNATEEVTST